MVAVVYKSLYGGMPAAYMYIITYLISYSET